AAISCEEATAFTSAPSDPTRIPTIEKQSPACFGSIPRRVFEGATYVQALRGSGMNAKKRIAVIGAGLGGLSIAGFLQRSGFPVTVYEQAPAFSRIGAGIILSANAMKAFRRLGIEQSLIETGIKPESYVSRAWDTGETMYEIHFDAASEARYGGPYINIHRGDLHGVLERVVAPGTIAFDHRLIGIDERNDAVRLTFENGVRVE